MGEAKKRHLLMDETRSVSITAINEARASEILSKGDVEDALRQILTHGIDPASAEAKRMMVMMHMRTKKMDEAKKLLDQLYIDVPDGLTFKMLGDWHFLVNDFQKSQNWYGRALSKIPNHPDIVHDYAVATVSMGKVDQGIQDFRKACELAPTRMDFKHHLAIMLVLGGYEKEGWEMMEYRMNVPGVVGAFPRPEAYWKGENLAGKTIVLRTEQGFGDTIMFMRYASLIHDQRPKKIYAFCQPAMTRFIEHYYPYVEAWNTTVPPPQDFDYHINLMSLPNVFKDRHIIAPAVPPQGDGIAVCWFGSPTHKADHLRTVGFERFMALMDEFPKERWLCGAYGFFDNKPDNIAYFLHRAKDWLDSAQILRKEVKLVITVDTAIAHLAGFLGIPVWLLLPKVPDFRWGMHGEQKWYESIRTYRCGKVLDWDPVFERVRADLKELTG